MPQYRYSARGAGGAPSSGTLAAQDQKDALAQLRRQGMTPLSLEEEGKAKKPGGSGGLFGGKKDPKPHVKSDDLVVFTRQFATMISAGIPILEALSILAEQMEDPGFRRALERVVESIRGGGDLSESLGLYPKIFPPIYANMVKAGEASGKLDEILQRLAEYQESTAAIKREVVGHDIGHFHILILGSPPSSCSVILSSSSSVPQAVPPDQAGAGDRGLLPTTA